uniref:Uncharacterized protein n=1 Tax=Rhizophora mucronata TaxID=61149 RepID=A0A2P2QB19_RHIMU
MKIGDKRAETKMDGGQKKTQLTDTERTQK